MNPWLNIVGIGEDGLEGLSRAARALLDTAEVLVGGRRHLAMIPADHPAERLPWCKPFEDSYAAIEAHAGKRVTVLTTGDPMYHGAGSMLSRRMKDAIAAVIPVPGAFSLAAARMRWPLQHTDCMTVLGRPAELLYLHLYPGARLLILTNDGNTPAQLAGMMTARGFGDSRVVALEHMGGPREARHETLAKDWGDKRVANLNTVAVRCVAGPGAVVLPRLAGLPDDAFEHDGMMTKREVRAVTLAALAPLPGRLLWDVGAGCGSVSIEWMRAGGRAIGIESNRGRAAIAARNAAALGVPEFELVIGDAPAALEGLETPDAVFVGGGLRGEGLFDACWAALKPGGRIVANAVTDESAAMLDGLYTRHGGELVRLAVSRARRTESWNQMKPITQWAGVKP